MFKRFQLQDGLILIRIFSGILIAHHGLGLFNTGHMDGNVAWLTDIHFPLPYVMAYIGKGTELAGGILLAIGLFTRISATLLVINMSVITFIMGHGKILDEDQHPFLFLLLFAVFLFYGGGKYSLDKYLIKM